MGCNYSIFQFLDYCSSKANDISDIEGFWSDDEKEMKKDANECNKKTLHKKVNNSLTQINLTNSTLDIDTHEKKDEIIELNYIVKKK